MLSKDLAIAVFIVFALVAGAAMGAYFGIARARPPLGASESAEIHDRRVKFKEAHIGQAKFALVVSGGLLFVAGVLLIIAVS